MSRIVVVYRTTKRRWESYLINFCRGNDFKNRPKLQRFRSKCKLSRNIAFHRGWSGLQKALAAIAVFAVAGSTATTITVAVTSSNENGGNSGDTYDLTREICVTPECTTAGQEETPLFVLRLVIRGKRFSLRTRYLEGTLISDY